MRTFAASIRAGWPRVQVERQRTLARAQQGEVRAVEAEIVASMAAAEGGVGLPCTTCAC